MIPRAHFCCGLLVLLDYNPQCQTVPREKHVTVTNGVASVKFYSRQYLHNQVPAMPHHSTQGGASAVPSLQFDDPCFWLVKPPPFVIEVPNNFAPSPSSLTNCI